MRKPFPLSWPLDWRRTEPRHRTPSRFYAVSFIKARDKLLHELRLLNAVNVVLTSNMPTKPNGMPYASSAKQVTDPGIAVWFVQPKIDATSHERVFACDRWVQPAENMWAIALMIAAIRGIERWGASDIVDRAFSGFNALPPGNDRGSVEVPPWQEILGMTAIVDVDGLAHPEVLMIAKAKHRMLIKDAHPDRGGSTERAAELNDALARAEKALAP